ncbi:MAG: PIN domain-containing protein [Muribaculaceae bacterium]|nr:PIN domain-containing protein [Muribaculaceae bacterium]
MNVYLIDYENTKILSGINKLSAEDRAVIFYSKNANTLTFDTLHLIQSSVAQIEYKCVDAGGKNALDFQLSSYLGYIVRQNENSNAKIFIVSKDKGFNYLVSFWKAEKGLQIKLLPEISGKTVAADGNASELESALKKCPLNLSEADIKKITEVIAQFKTKQAINNGLMKYFRDGEKVGSLTKVIKPYIKDKK